MEDKLKKALAEAITSEFFVIVVTAPFPKIALPFLSVAPANKSFAPSLSPFTYLVAACIIRSFLTCGEAPLKPNSERLSTTFLTFSCPVNLVLK